jgi:hypothetical protein
LGLVILFLETLRGLRILRSGRRLHWAGNSRTDPFVASQVGAAVRRASLCQTFL